MFGDLNSRMQAFGRVVRQYRHFASRDYVAVIYFFVDVMNRATGNDLASFERLFPRFQSGKFWQQRWMNIDDSPRECLQHRRFQNAHESGKHDQLYFCVAQHLHEFCLSVWLQPCAKLAWR